MRSGTPVAVGSGFVAAAVGLAGLRWGSAAAVVGTQLAAAAAILVAGARVVRSPARPRPQPDDAANEAGRRQWSTLYRLQSTVMIGVQSQHHYDAALRPRLQRVLHAVLAGRHGIDSAARPELARDRLGPGLWPLVDPDRPPSSDSRPGGVSVRDLERLVDRIERL